MPLQNIGLTALFAYQRALQLTAHNIANAGTPGYSRRTLDLVSLQGGFTPAGPIGAGVAVADFRRQFDAVLFHQMLGVSAAVGQHRVMAGLADQVDVLFGANGIDLTGAFSALGGSLETLAGDPTSIASRVVVLSEASALADRFQTLDQRFGDLRADTNGRIRAYAVEINALTRQVADLNGRITEGSVNGEPHDLLDQRDQAIRRLSELIDIQVVTVDDGTVNLTLLQGQNLVLGSQSTDLTDIRSEFDAGQRVLALATASGPVPITGSLGGGELGGVLAFRDEVLDPAQNALGRLAMVYADALNQQQARGLDLNGNLGLPFFTVPAPEVLASRNNSNLPTDPTSVNVDDFGALTGDDYRLRFDGVGWQLTNLRSGQNVPLVPSGSDFLADGLRITVDPGAAAGDEWEIRPTRAGAGDLVLALNDPSGIAAAAALRATPGTLNLGSGTISSPEVLDPTDPALLSSVSIVFDSATTFQVNGGPSQAYVPGTDIVVNGWRVVIDGAPATGDRFEIAANNTGEVGNGANALLMGGLDRLSLIQGGTLSVADALRDVVTSVGVQASSLETTVQIQERLLADIDARLQSVQGVNLDEEALKLQEYEQAYLAATRIFTVADELFQTLLGAVGR